MPSLYIPASLRAASYPSPCGRAPWLLPAAARDGRRAHSCGSRPNTPLLHRHMSLAASSRETTNYTSSRATTRSTSLMTTASWSLPRRARRGMDNGDVSEQHGRPRRPPARRSPTSKTQDAVQPSLCIHIASDGIESFYKGFLFLILVHASTEISKYIWYLLVFFLMRYNS
nr:uncharacterized protein LOC109769626 [Aegilops tauschii subsp. strangulata]